MIPQHEHSTEEQAEYDMIPYNHTLDSMGNPVPYNPVDRDGDNMHGVDWLEVDNDNPWICFIQKDNCEFGPSDNFGTDYVPVQRVDFDGSTCEVVEAKWPWTRPQQLGKCARPYICDYHSNSFITGLGMCAAVTSALMI